MAGTPQQESKLLKVNGRSAVLERTPDLVVRGPLNGYASYGLLTTWLVGSFLDLGVDVVLVPTNGIGFDEKFDAFIPDRVKRVTSFGDVRKATFELQVSPPGWLMFHDRSVVFTMHESTRLTTGQRDSLGRAAAVITPTKWNAGMFRRELGKLPVHVVPLGVDLSVFRPRAFPAGNACVFGTAGRFVGAGTRKNVDQVLRVFLREFDGNPKARLQVKCFPDCQVDTLRHAQVEFVREFLSGPSLADWYSRQHCFVSSSAGEGWGLMLQEAMAIGRPVITPMFGGVTAFAESGACVVVPHHEEPVPDGDEYYAGRRAVVSDDALAASMRQIYDEWQSGGLRHRGWLAALQASKFPWTACPLGILDVLVRQGFMPARPVGG